MPVVYFSQLIPVAYNRNSSDAAPDQQIFNARKLEDLAAKQGLCK